MTILNAETITDREIRKLRTEAGEAGTTDHAQIDLCNRALTADGDTHDQDGNPIAYADWTQQEARQACADAINHARAQQDA